MINWQQQGAWSGGTVTAVALSPTFLTDGIALAATPAGLYRATDGGIAWQRSIVGFSDLSAVAVAFAPTGTAFAASAAGRLYRSPDGGASWSELTTWAGLGLITAIAPSPTYAADQSLFVATPNGVYRSLDDGSSWEEASFGLLDLEVIFLQWTAGAGGDLLWAGTALGGCYRSRNQALAWRESGMGLPDTAIQCMAVVPGPTPTLFVGTEGNGIYRSDDGGANWQPTGAALADASVNCLVTCTAGDRPILLAGTAAGLYRSPDGGTSWQASNAELFALSLATAGKTAIAGAFQSGLWRSDDGGQVWQPVGAIAAHTPPLLYPVGGRLYALDNEGTLATSADNGANWVALDLPAITAATSAGHSTFYAAGDTALLHMTTDSATWNEVSLPTEQATALVHSLHGLLLSNAAGELFHTTDELSGWRQVAVPWTGDAVLHLLRAPQTNAAQALYAVTAHANAAGNYAITVWEAAAGVDEWLTLANLETAIPSVLVAQPAIATPMLYLATGHRLIQLAFDTAQNEWRVRQHFFDEAVRITALAVAPDFTTEQTVLAATTAGLYQSSDGGVRWELNGDTPADLPIVALLPPVGGAWGAVTLGGAVWRAQG
jgi:hypothetical protein